MKIDQLRSALIPLGMIIRGGFHPLEDDGALLDTQTLFMIGNAGPEMWRAFSKRNVTIPNPLDVWTRESLTPIAKAVDAHVVFPFDGPPFYPFQHWATQADDVFPSPIGPLIHPVFGLWHAYRAAFLFEEKIDVPSRASIISPCATCADRACLHTCPVHAFTPENYDVSGCRSFIAAPEGADCLHAGCRARRACPVGQDYIYSPDQAEFHMQSFLKAK